MSDPEYLFFPIRNEDGFRVTGLTEYQHMINTIVEAQIELTYEYPDQQVMVVYRTEDENAQ